uniref:Proteasome assembly chaperone 4 n=1 Tax=Apteryx owenii TaxID=8824 RepID=A0A8B9PY73_APTOW
PAGLSTAAGFHALDAQLGEQLVHFHAMRLRDSLFLWVGAAPALASLAVAMCNPRPSLTHNCTSEVAFLTIHPVW